MHKMPPTINDVRSRLPSVPTEEQHPTQNIKGTFSSAVIPKMKNFALFSNSIFRGMKLKHLNSQVNEERIHLKAFPSAKAIQLNHYVHVGINHILRCKDANRITCQSYNIDKLYVSSISPSTISSIDIGQINEVITTILLDHQNITSNDLRVDGIHLANVRMLIFRGVLSVRFYKSRR